MSDCGLQLKENSTLKHIRYVYTEIFVISDSDANLLVGAVSRYSRETLAIVCRTDITEGLRYR